MSIITMDDKISSINDDETQNNLNEKTMKYKNLDDEFNLVSLKTRFMLQKINALMEENKDEDINLDDFNDPKKADYKNRIMKKKIIQYYCTNKNDKNAFIPPSEAIIKKIRQFKKWQNYEIFQKRGIKNYLDNLMPDYKVVHNTKKLVDDKVNLVTKINVKSNNNNSITFLPKINSNYSNIEKDKENESNYFYDISNNYQKRLIRNKSMDELIKNSFSISKINQNSKNSSKINQKSAITKVKNRRKLSTLSNNKSSSLVNIFDSSNNKKLNKYNNSKELKSFEESVFCLNKSLIPMSIDKSVITTPFGGGLLHCNSLMRNKNINDLVPYYSPKKVQEKLLNYKNQRSKVIHNKDYMYIFDNTFITNKNKYHYYDYQIY